MDIIFILLLCRYFGLFSLLFFIIAAQLKEQKGNLNGKRSRYWIGAGVSILIIVVSLSVNLSTGLMWEVTPTSEEHVMISGGLLSLGSFFLVAAALCVWKLFSKKPHRISNEKWLNASIILFGTAFLIDFIGLVFALI